MLSLQDSLCAMGTVRTLLYTSAGRQSIPYLRESRAYIYIYFQTPDTTVAAISNCISFQISSTEKHVIGSAVSHPHTVEQARHDPGLLKLLPRPVDADMVYD